MALSDTYKAISSVTLILQDQLGSKTGLNVATVRPNENKGDGLSIFLYEAAFDPSLKNVPLEENQSPPLWLVLKYLITGHAANGVTDSPIAHENLGRGIRALQELSFLNGIQNISEDIYKALKDNPEPLKISFEEVNSDLLSKLMQGQDEKYLFSMGFQVRPIMISTAELPSYSFLVGVNYGVGNPEPNNGEENTSDVSNGPERAIRFEPQVIGEEGIQLEVLTSLGPEIQSISPPIFEPQESIIISGSRFTIQDVTVTFNGKEVTIVDPPSKPLLKDKIECRIDNLIQDNRISAGSQVIILHQKQVIVLHQKQPTVRMRSSNPVIARLLPRLDDVVFEPETDPEKYGKLILSGALLGGANDEISLALYKIEEKDGKVVKLFEIDIEPPQENQNTLTFSIPQDQKPGPSEDNLYWVILRVNGQQARKSFPVELPP